MTALDRNDGYLFPMAAYTGSSLASLVEVACGIGGITFRAEAGTTYYFQVATSWVVEFQLDVAPPPTAGFTYYPGDPSPFDTVQFYDASYDPGGIGIESWSWDFGDGTTSSAQNPTHRFASDGDYTVDLSVATFDDRTGSVSQVVRVATHDVTIAKFTVPNAATSGQTRPISVGISDLRYPENVQVQLFRSNVNGGFDLVGTLAQAVPVRGGNRTTPFGFNYTFTKDDAMLGKVTFRAEATIVDHRDALPADNEAVALPCKVVK
jgi:PKD repeat protein